MQANFILYSLCSHIKKNEIRSKEIECGPSICKFDNCKINYFILLIILKDNFDETNGNYNNYPSALAKITMLLLKSIENMQILYAFSFNTKYHFLEICNIQRQDAEHYFTKVIFTSKNCT